MGDYLAIGACIAVCLVFLFCMPNDDGNYPGSKGS